MVDDRHTQILNPSLHQIVTEINAVNRAWKASKELLGDTVGITVSLRDIKSHLQVRLLRAYASEHAYLVLDTETPSEEPLYGIRLRQAVGGQRDAAHLPARVAEKFLSMDEIQSFSRS